MFFRVILLTRDRALAIYPDVSIEPETPPQVKFYTMTPGESCFRQISTPLGETMYRKGVSGSLTLPCQPYTSIDSMSMLVGAAWRWAQPCNAIAVRR